MFLTACSGHLDKPQVAFGKKCAVTTDGQITYSYVWLYSKDAGLNANKETCKQLED
tara:strand:- start:9281 stop:9448 length:168 start_codon:yes stop_codon:yes gene_type:complete